MTHYDKNAVTHFGAPTNGDPCNDAFDMQNDFITANLNPGDTFYFDWSGNDFVFDSSNGTWRRSMCVGVLGGISGIMNVAGSSFAGPFTSLGVWRATFDDNLHTARLATILPGATSAALLSLADLTLDGNPLQTGQCIAITGQDLFGIGGSPMDPRLFEYRRITEIDAVGGVIRWAEPLLNGYKSTWPNYWPGAASGADATDGGGPATLLYLDPSWDLDVTYEAAGASFDNGGGQLHSKCRRLTVNGASGNNCFFAGPGLIPTACDSFVFNHVTNGEEETEFDKIYNIVSSSNTTWDQIKCQSGVGEVTLTGDTVTRAINGLSRKVTLVDTDVGGDISCGPIAVGYTEEFRITRGTLGGNFLQPDLSDDISGWEWVGDGVFRTDTPTLGVTKRLLTIGAWFTFVGSRNFGNPFQVTDAWQDATYYYAQTTLAAVPTFDMGTSGFLAPDKFSIIPCLRTYFTDTGVAYLDNRPQGRPFLEYNEYTFSGAQDGATPYELTAIGSLVKIVVTVSQACLGIATCSLKIDQNNPFLLDETNTVIRPNLGTVDCKTTGTRTIYPDRVEGSVGADDLSFDSGWVIKNINPIVVNNTSAATQQPTVRVQIFTDIGVPTELFVSSGSFALTGNAVSFSKTTANPIKVHFRRKKV